MAGCTKIRVIASPKKLLYSAPLLLYVQSPSLFCIKRAKSHILLPLSESHKHWQRQTGRRDDGCEVPEVVDVFPMFAKNGKRWFRCPVLYQLKELQSSSMFNSPRAWLVLVIIITCTASQRLCRGGWIISLLGRKVVAWSWHLGCTLAS